MSLQDKILNIVGEKLGLDPTKISTDASFVGDLGADSLDIVELIMEFEDNFGLDIEDDDAQKITTVQTAIDYITKMLDQKNK